MRFRFSLLRGERSRACSNRVFCGNFEFSVFGLFGSSDETDAIQRAEIVLGPVCEKILFPEENSADGRQSRVRPGELKSNTI